MNEFKYHLRFFVDEAGVAIGKILTNHVPMIPQIGASVWLDGEVLTEDENNEKYCDKPFEVRDVYYTYGKDFNLIDVMLRGIAL